VTNERKIGGNKMILYHGTPDDIDVLKIGTHVTPQFSRAVKYARHPGNSEQGNQCGYVYKFETDEVNIAWALPEDCEQGELRQDIIPLERTVCDLPLAKFPNLIKIGSNKPDTWGSGKAIVWEKCEKRSAQPSISPGMFTFTLA
jgi:hypothetical protein